MAASYRGPVQQVLNLPTLPSPREINPESDWCQRWTDNRQHSWVHRSDGGFDASRYRVAPIADRVAKAYVLAHHYSATYPAAVHRYGLYYGEGNNAALVGVAVFGVPTSAAVLTNAFPDLEPYVQSLELSRLVLEGAPARSGLPSRAPANSESWLITRCLTGPTFPTSSRRLTGSAPVATAGCPLVSSGLLPVVQRSSPPRRHRANDPGCRALRQGRGYRPPEGRGPREGLSGSP